MSSASTPGMRARTPRAAANAGPARHVACAAAAMFLVGTMAAVSGPIGSYPVYGGQALRYVLGAAILLVVARSRGLGPVRLTGREWTLLILLSLTGLVLFNVCLIEAARVANPALPGIMLSTVPLALALLTPLTRGGASGDRRAPSARIVAAALVVAAGAALATGAGGGNPAGLLWSLGVLGCEVCFSLLALPLLPKLGAIRVSAYTAALAVPSLLVIGIMLDGTAVLRAPTVAEALGLSYLGVVITAGAFLLWYSALPRLGPDRAGLFAGIVPVGAMATTAVLGLGLPSAADLGGAALVITGILLGLTGRRRTARQGEPLGSDRGVPAHLSGVNLAQHDHEQRHTQRDQQNGRENDQCQDSGTHVSPPVLTAPPD